MDWERALSPIELADGSKLRTLAEYRSYIQELPEFELRARAWDMAIASLENAAERGGVSVSIARAVFLKAMNPGPVKRPTNR